MAPAVDTDEGRLVDRLESLFVEHVRAVYSVGFRIVWSSADAEEVVQRTFLRAAGGLGGLRDVGKARSWLLRVAYREAIAVVRARRDCPTDPGELPERGSAEACPAERAVALAVAEVVQQALARMDEDERLAVVLRDVEGLSMREVSEVTGVGLSAAKMRVHRGRQRLRVLLGPMEVW